MRFILLFLICSISLNLSGQDYFVKRIQFDDRTNTGRRIIQHQDRFFALVGHFCENLECGSIAELSLDGDTLWRTTMPDIDIARSTITIFGDTIAATGNNASTLSQFRMGHFNLDGEKLGETIEIEHPTENFHSMFQLNTVRFEGKTLITGRGIQNDTMRGLIYVMNSQNELDTLIQLEPQDRISVMWDIEINSNKELLTFHDIEEDAFGIWYKKINKFDKDLNLIWSYTSEVSNQWAGGSFGAALEDGRVLLIVYTPFGHSLDKSIRAINPDISIDWQYNPDQSQESFEEVTNITQLASGDIIALGRHTDMTLDNPIDSAPFLYKMTPDGEIIWKRVFYEIDPQTGDTRNGFVRDIVELDNGDIYGIGTMKYEGTNNVFVFKIDENGCLNSEDCGFVQVITDTEDVTIDHKIKVYPNPATDKLTIESEDEIQTIDIYTLDGKLVLSSDHTDDVDVSSLDKGMYLIRLRGREYMGAMKFVKM